MWSQVNILTEDRSMAITHCAIDSIGQRVVYRWPVKVLTMQVSEHGGFSNFVHMIFTWYSALLICSNSSFNSSVDGCLECCIYKGKGRFSPLLFDPSPACSLENYSTSYVFFFQYWTAKIISPTGLPLVWIESDFNAFSEVQNLPFLPPHLPTTLYLHGNNVKILEIVNAREEGNTKKSKILCLYPFLLTGNCRCRRRWYNKMSSSYSWLEILNAEKGYYKNSKSSLPTHPPHRYQASPFRNSLHWFRIFPLVSFKKSSQPGRPYSSQ